MVPVWRSRSSFLRLLSGRSPLLLTWTGSWLVARRAIATGLVALLTLLALVSLALPTLTLLRPWSFRFLLLASFPICFLEAL